MNSFTPSKFSGFYKLDLSARQDLIAKYADLSLEEQEILKNFGYFSSKSMDSMVENVIGNFELPLGIATNFIINQKEYLIPMVTEEPSVIAAASNGARFTRKYGGFQSSPVQSIMTGQIQIIYSDRLTIAKVQSFISENKSELLKIANENHNALIKLGGGARDLSFREINTARGLMLVINLDVNVVDAMGANIVNSMVEKIAQEIYDATNCMIILKIISNLSIKRIARSKAIFDEELLGGPEVVENILDAFAFAQSDPFRAATHNKGVMNGISALALATGNDTRAIEAGAHAYAYYGNFNKQYGPITSYYKDSEKRLVGEIALPLPMATIGGIINHHPMVKICHKILKIQSAEELSQIAAAVGLAQNIAALRALADEGIQEAHMTLHNRKNQNNLL
ncbi:MAG: hydroxymethylglutaryl-CoA reductase, degradative [Promethearchaeota archaeon]